MESGLRMSDTGWKEGEDNKRDEKPTKIILMFLYNILTIQFTYRRYQ